MAGKTSEPPSGLRVKGAMEGLVLKGAWAEGQPHAFSKLRFFLGTRSQGGQVENSSKRSELKLRCPSC